LDSGDNASHELFQAGERRAYQGRCFAYLRSAGGNVTLAASAPGLDGAEITIPVANPTAAE